MKAMVQLRDDDRSARNIATGSSQLEPVLGIRFQARCFGLVGLLGAVVCLSGLALMKGEARLAVSIVSAILGGAMLLVWSLLLWLSQSFTRDARVLLQGDKISQWNVPDPAWSSFLASEHRRFRWVMPVAAVTGMAMGIFFGACIREDGRMLYRSVFMTFAVPSVLGAGIVAMIGGFFRHVGRIPSYIAMHQDGFVVIGADGYYLPGEYRPWRSFGQYLKKAELEGPKEEAFRRLVLTFKVKSKHGYVDSPAYLPVPNDRTDEASRVVEWLNRRFGG
jgi:hypothetical protein